MMLRIAAFLLLAFATAAHADKKVTVPLATTPVIEITGLERVCVVEFEGVQDRMNLNIQTAGFIRKRLLQEEVFESVRLVPLEIFLDTVTAIKSQGIAEDGAGYWQALGEALQCDLLIFGSYQYDSEYRPGYVSERVFDERTGYTYYRDSYREMMGYKLNLRVEVVNTVEGRRLARRNVTTERIIENQSSASSGSLYSMMSKLYRPIHDQMFPRPRKRKFFLLD